MSRASKMILGFVLYFFIASGQGECAQKPQACVDKTCVDLEIAKSPEAMARGLSGREKLGAVQGMLFAFDMDGSYGFWMKDMKFNLDILWLDGSGRVVYVQENLPPCTPQECPVYKPQQTARYVLEVNAGFAAKHGIKSGSAVHFLGL